MRLAFGEYNTLSVPDGTSVASRRVLAGSALGQESCAAKLAEVGSFAVVLPEAGS